MSEKSEFERLSIKLTEKNERIFREMHQFVRDIGYPFEKFINDWIDEHLTNLGFE